MKRFFLVFLLWLLVIPLSEARTVLWRQPTNITDVTQVWKMVNPAPGWLGDQTWFSQYFNCTGNVVPVRIKAWSINQFTGRHKPAKLLDHQIGCSPGVAWGTAVEADGGAVSYIADNTSLVPPNSGIDLWFSHAWNNPPNIFKSGAAYLSFSGEVMVPWQWTGQLINNQWKVISQHQLPWGYGGSA